MSGPSSPDTTVNCRPAFVAWLESLDPFNPPARVPSTMSSRTLDWWRAIRIKARRCGVPVIGTDADIVRLFSPFGSSDSDRPPAVEMIAGYLAAPGVPEWVSLVRISDPFRFQRFVRPAWEHMGGPDSDLDAWMLGPVIEWFIRDHLARHNASKTDPVALYYRRRWDKRPKVDPVAALSAGSAEPTVGVEHTSSGDAEGGFNDGGAP